MHRRLVLAAALAASALPAAAHDLFLRPESFRLAPGSEARVRMLNGTFATSENPVARDRLRELALLGPGGLARPREFGWAAQGKATLVELALPVAGTHGLGISLVPRELRLEGREFNEYLKEEGVLDVLEARTRGGELGKPARERYSKHVKTLLQVGDPRGDVSTPFGHPAEIVPLANPYALAPGATLEALCLVDGRPAAGVVVIAGGEGARGPLPETRATSDADGRVKVKLAEPGQWFLKFIRMVRSKEPGLDYESKWATLTFELR